MRTPRSQHQEAWQAAQVVMLREGLGFYCLEKEDGK